jgi:signal transduction histidine kinase
VEVCKIAKEALSNAFSHAGARRIESEVEYSKRFLRLRVRDDGIGVNSAILRNGGRSGHWGISGMNERAKSIHGRLTIWSRPGTGTEVELTIPGFVAFATNTPDTRLRR